jgi:hypothetical protein
MAFQVSPGVQVREFDLTTVVPAVDVAVGAYAGVFRWGPVGKTILVDSEATLAKRLGTPTSFNAEGWLAAASFLGYSGALQVSRAANTAAAAGANAAVSAIANTGAVTNVYAQTVKNEDDYDLKSFDANVLYVAKYPGALGNSLRVSVCDTANQFATSINLASLGTGASLAINVGSNAATITILAGSNAAAQTAATTLASQLTVTDLIEVGNTSIGRQTLKVTNIDFDSSTDVLGNSTSGNATLTISFENDYRLSTDFTTNTSVNKYWEFWELVDLAPGQSNYVAEQGNSAANDELHVVVVDNLGKFTGVPGTVLEVFTNLSRVTDARTADNETNYYKTVINQQSEFVWWAHDRANAPSANATAIASATTTSILNISLQAGQDGADEANVSIGTLAAAWDLFQNAEDVDVGLVITGKPRGGSLDGQLTNYLIDNIAENRKDCVVFASPRKQAVVNNVGNEAVDIVAHRNTLRSSSYAFLDSGYKYMYDRYNDVYRYVPLCGDMAGLAARTEADRDAWWSPAGFNRGQVKNLVRLAYNPKKSERDVLYKSGVNPVVTFTGQGTVLYGDKTLLAKPSAFDRINVRRLFIVLEKAISTAAKYSLFEFNDEFTRAQFRNMVIPFLRDVKARRGLTDFLVVCDSTNNPGSVIDRNEFVGDIYLKPARAINFITLNFVAVGTDVQFNEVVGKFG